MPDKKIKFSCVVDNKPHFVVQSIVWAYTLLKSGTAYENNIVIHAIRGIENEYFQFFEGLGIEVLEVRPYGAGFAAYCNKLVQLDSPAFENTDIIVLCDTDIAFASDISETIAHTENVRAKIVDNPAPLFEILENLKTKSGITKTPEIVSPDFVEDAKTYSTNCNGGLYILPRVHLKTLRSPWKKWSNWCLSQEPILGRYTRNSDQLGFCFAMLETRTQLTHLPSPMNFPIHLNHEVIRKKACQIPPMVLHYHDKINQKLLLLQTTDDTINQSIKKANKMIEGIHDEWIEKNKYAKNRYQEFKKTLRAQQPQRKGLIAHIKNMIMSR